MRSLESASAYEQYRAAQVMWASTEDLLLIMAQELIKLKDESGMNLFWDDTEERFLRDYIENATVAARN